MKKKVDKILYILGAVMLIITAVSLTLSHIRRKLSKSIGAMFHKYAQEQEIEISYTRLMESLEFLSIPQLRALKEASQAYFDGLISTTEFYQLVEKADIHMTHTLKQLIFGS